MPANVRCINPSFENSSCDCFSFLFSVSMLLSSTVEPWMRNEGLIANMGCVPDLSKCAHPPRVVEFGQRTVSWLHYLPYSELLHNCWFCIECAFSPPFFLDYPGVFETFISPGLILHVNLTPTERDTRSYVQKLFYFQISVIKSFWLFVVLRSNWFCPNRSFGLVTEISLYRKVSEPFGLTLFVIQFFVLTEVNACHSKFIE